MQVFISYARVDKEFAEHLYHALADFELNVWMDQFKIGTGSKWDQEVQKALEESDTMLLLLSPASIKSDNVTDEWSFFIDKNRTIVPLLIETCDVPFRLRRRQWIDFTLDYKLAFQQMIRALGSPPLVDPESTQQLQPAKKPPSAVSMAATAPGLPTAPPDARPRLPQTGTLGRTVAPEVGVRMFPVVWNDAYHWLTGMGRGASDGDLMISQREVKFIPHARPIITIPMSSLVSVAVQRSIDPYLKLTYYNREGKFQSIVVMAASREKRAAENTEILNLLKLVSGRSLD
jgi:hypothetical protein